MKGTFPIDKFQEIQTPFYYYDTNVLRQTLKTINEEAGKHEGFEVHYAVKANANPKVLNIICQAGLGADCVSGGEIQAAIKAGFDYTFSDYVGYMDADLQTTPEDFNLLLDGIESHSMVIGIRANRKDTFFKRAQSKIANGFRKMMTHDGATDTGCPLKVLHTDVAKRIPMFKGMHRFLPALVLLQDGCNYSQVPVRHFPRVAGSSKYHLWNRLVGPFADCFAYRWMKPRYINYKVGENDL